MKKTLANTAILVAAPLLLTACGGTAMIAYHKGPPKETSAFSFVIPRTVVKIEADVPKGSGGPGQQATGVASATSLKFTPVPVIVDENGKNLPVFYLTDDSGGGFNLVSTSVTNVTYADHLIIQSVGTAITDHRKAAIDAFFGVVGIVGKGLGFASATPPTACEGTLERFQPFVIKDRINPTGPDQAIRIPNNPCWGYQIEDTKSELGDAVPGSELITELPVEKKVNWFPYPACASYRITVVPCTSPSGACTPKADGKQFTGVVPISDGTRYRKIPLPPKGKVTMHSDFCVADVTSEPSPLATNWDLVNQIITDTKALMKKDK